MNIVGIAEMQTVNSIYVSNTLIKKKTLWGVRHGVQTV